VDVNVKLRFPNLKLKNNPTVKLRKFSLLLKVVCSNAENTVEYKQCYNLENRMKSFEPHSPKMQSVYNELGKYALHGRRCILLGPSGSGKEHAARFYYDEYKKQEGRADAQFFSINCAGLTAGTAHTELFGHVKGVFAGTIGDRKGLFQRAKKSVLFLDEVGDIPKDVIPAMLRALDPEHGEAYQLGGDDNTYKTTDIVIICATEQPASDMRISLLSRFDKQIFVPGLDERKEDVGPAVIFFVKRSLLKYLGIAGLMEKYCSSLEIQETPSDNDNQNESSQKQDALADQIGLELAPLALMRSAWPANFRTLSTAVDSAIICAEQKENLGDFIEEIKNEFEKQADRYGSKKIESSCCLSFCSESTENANDYSPDEPLRRRLLSILPNVSGREEEALRITKFLVEQENIPFLRRDLEHAVGGLKSRTMQNHIKLLIDEQVLSRTDDSVRHLQYTPDVIVSSSALDFIGSSEFLPPDADDLQENESFDLGNACPIINNTSRIFVEGSNPEQRTAFAMAVARNAEKPYHISYVVFNDDMSLEEFLDRVESRCITEEILNSVEKQHNTFEERVAYCAGFVSAQCGSAYHLLVVDYTETLTQGKQVECLASIMQNWSWIKFVVCGEKMPTLLADQCSVVTAE